MTRLSAEALEALANQRLLDAAPGQITAIRELPDQTIEVDSFLASPFEDKTPSRWMTTLSAVDGRTLSSVVTQQSVDFVDCGCGTGKVVVDPAVRSTGVNDVHVHSAGHLTWVTTQRLPRLFTPSYPKLFAAEGERCSKVQYRTGGRVHLQCVRRAGHVENHLMDIMDRDAVPGSTAASIAERRQIANILAHGGDPS